MPRHNARSQTLNRWSVRAGDCLEVLPSIEDASIDATVTDPPYGIDFQGADWDGREIRRAARTRSARRLSSGEAFQRWASAWGEECARVLKPGGHLIAFGAPRTAHRLACGLEDAGLEIRDQLMWLYAQGMPKGRRLPGGKASGLKPAHELIVLARRRPAGKLDENVALYGTGALNVGACSVAGRYPANVISSHSLDCSSDGCTTNCPSALIDESADLTRTTRGFPPSRFLFCPKTTRGEREAGCEHLPQRVLDLFPSAQSKRPAGASNHHPTVKPIELMRWVVRLVSPDGGLVLDPFCGSGSTGCAAILENRRFIGVERDPAFVEIARARIEHWDQLEPEQRTALRDRLRPDTRRRPSARRVSPLDIGTHREPQEEPHEDDAMPLAVRLDEASIDAMARRILELLQPQVPDEAPPTRLLNAAEVAETLGVERSWVYEHAIELGAIRIGDGPRPRLRFDIAAVNRRLGSESVEPSSADTGRSFGIAPDSVPLLPIHGQPELTSSLAAPARQPATGTQHA